MAEIGRNGSEIGIWEEVIMELVRNSFCDGFNLTLTLGSWGTLNVTDLTLLSYPSAGTPEGNPVGFKTVAILGFGICRTCLVVL